MRHLFASCLLVASVLLLAPVHAVAAAWVSDTGSGHLGRDADYLFERDGQFSLEHVQQLFNEGAFRRAEHDALSFGIDAQPLWVRVRVENPSASEQQRHLLLGATWLDAVDIYMVMPTAEVRHVRAGDALPSLQRPVPGLGYMVAHVFPPGVTELFMRVQTADPLVLPMTLLGDSAARDTQRDAQYTYGFIYGFLAALLAYNLMLYIGLRQQSHRNYSIYLAAFIGLNLAYTGHGYAWFWSDWPQIQRYIIFLFMGFFAAAGLRFAADFLALRDYTPGTERVLRLGCAAFLAVIVLAVALRQQAVAAYAAFTLALLFSLVMVELGWAAVARQYPAGRYFLAAACFGMAGTLVTTLTVWGWVPYSRVAYRAVEFGLIVEASLLALAVAYLVRQHEMARRQAEQQASLDPLTGLFNRRALLRLGEGVLGTARRTGRPVSLVLFDIDHFKLINDRHGHGAGDHVLRETARLINEQCRAGDLVARWGGEEFLMLLPDTDADHAAVLVTRLRDCLAERIWLADQDRLAVRASFGIAVLEQGQRLEELVRRADEQLYRAKREGRDRICVAPSSAGDALTQGA